jgi:hypothetical protein
VDNRNEVREFLVSRRAKITPEQAGLPAGSKRRVPGLRRFLLGDRPMLGFRELAQVRRQIATAELLMQEHVDRIGDDVLAKVEHRRVIDAVLVDEVA